jgi:hypothetical protein
MPPLTLTIPAVQAAAIAAEVERAPGFDTDQGPVVRVWIGPSLELVLDLDAADRLADALVDALAVDDDGRPVLHPASARAW